MFKATALKETIARINPDTLVIAHTLCSNPENIQMIYSGCDVIVEALDEVEMKDMLAETIQEKMPEYPDNGFRTCRMGKH